MDEAPSRVRREALCVFSWLHVFYSPSYEPGSGSLVIESEMEKNKEREGGGLRVERG